MANNIINRYIGAIVIGAVLVAVPGCTDTWDDHYDSDGVVSGTTATLWDQIKDNPNYSRFADIVRHAKYYKDNTQPVSTYTYEDILKGGQVNTVWVPDNSVLTEAEYQKWMQMLASDNIMDGYNVQQQFLGNHIALWRHNISEPGIDTVKMINGKNLFFDKGARTFAGIPLGAYNIASNNGVLHVLKGIAPFHYNFYEHLKYGGTSSQFAQYVVAQDTTYFFKEASIEGLPDENGNPTYVDSVYVTSNMLFERRSYTNERGGEIWQTPKKGFNARINNEDSVFVMLMPTDAAWNAAYEKLKSAYNYATVYDDKSKGDAGSSTSLPLNGALDADSMQRQNIAVDLVAPLVFNIHKQPKRGGSEMWTLDMFKSGKGYFDDAENPEIYMLNTYGDTLRATSDWMPSTLFDVEPIEMSNGLAYEVNSLNFPSEYLTPDVEVEVEGSGLFYNMNGNGSKYKVGPGSRRLTFSNQTYKDITSVYGEVSNNNFYYFEQSGATAGPKVEFKLEGNSPSAYVPNAQVMSGRYDIQIVLVPYWYAVYLQPESKVPDEFYIREQVVNPEDETDVQWKVTDQLNTQLIEQLAAMYKCKIRTQISYNNNAKKDKTSSWVNSEYSGLKVDTITVAEDFEFPYSYKNMRYTYPTLIFECSTSKNDAKNGYIFNVLIDKIILKRKN